MPLGYSASKRMGRESFCQQSVHDGKEALVELVRHTYNRISQLGHGFLVLVEFVHNGSNSLRKLWFLDGGQLFLHPRKEQVGFNLVETLQIEYKSHSQPPVARADYLSPVWFGSAAPYSRDVLHLAPTT
jgi:hypothetical protein